MDPVVAVYIRVSTDRQAETRTEAAARFCTAHDELRDHFRFRHHMNETVSLAEQRRLIVERWDKACAVLEAA